MVISRCDVSRLLKLLERVVIRLVVVKMFIVFISMWWWLMCVDRMVVMGELIVSISVKMIIRLVMVDMFMLKLVVMCGSSGVIMKFLVLMVKVFRVRKFVVSSEFDGEDDVEDMGVGGGCRGVNVMLFLKMSVVCRVSVYCKMIRLELDW